MGFFEWWSERSAWIRYGVAGVFILISTLLLLGGVVWFWGWAVGGILLLFAGRSQSERNGYRF